LTLVAFTLTNCGPDKPKAKVKVSNSTTHNLKTETKKSESKPQTEDKQDPDQEVSLVESTVTPEQLAKANELIASVSDADLSAVDPKKIFRVHCAICHGFKGDMKINGAKDLTISKLPLQESVAQVYHGKGLMTPYKGILSNAEIVSIAKWIEGLRK
jgi:cytochrome c6